MEKQRFHIGIRNAVNNEPLELHFLDDIYDTFDWWSGEYTNMVQDLVSQIKNANPSKIKLIINSAGGDANIGLAIYNFLKNYDAKIETEIIGMAGSIASVFAMAAEKGKLRIARNGFMIIHQAWGGATGNSKDLREAADVVDKYTSQIVDIYSQRTGKSKEGITQLIANGDYWMSGSEAVEQGFADETFNDNAGFQIAAKIKSLPDEYHNIPGNLIQNATESGNSESKGIFQSLKSEIMDLKKHVNAFIESFKGNKGEEIVNLLQEPLNKMVEGIQADVNEAIQANPTPEVEPEGNPTAATPVAENDPNPKEGEGNQPVATPEGNEAGEQPEGTESAQDDLSEKILNAITQKFGERITALETANASLKKENETLKDEVINKIGKGVKAKSGAEDNQPKQIGYFTKREN